jgi:hypothetical protein
MAMLFVLEFLDVFTVDGVRQEEEEYFMLVIWGRASSNDILMDWVRILSILEDL